MEKITLQLEFEYEPKEVLELLQNEGSLWRFNTTDDSILAADYIAENIYDTYCDHIYRIKYNGKFKIVPNETVSA